MLRYTPYREEAWREAIDAAMATRRAEYEWVRTAYRASYCRETDVQQRRLL